MNHNYYIAKVFAKNCILDIRVNDIPLMRQSIEGDITFERPINYLIEKSGEQSLAINILPFSSSNKIITEYELNVEIWKYDASGHLLSELENVLTVNINSKDHVVSPTIKRIFVAEVGYEISRWSGCDVLQAGIDIKPMVVTFMRELTQILSTKQFGIYAQLIEQRERNICKSLYLGEDEIQNRMDILIDCLNNGFEYIPLKGQKNLQYFANRRVISVVDVDNKSALQFYNADTQELLTMDLLLGIPSGSNKLHII